MAAFTLTFVLLAAGAAWAARERIVEGHTVYLLMDSVRTVRGFDIAVLAREDLQYPNVLWFNDQWKTFFGGSGRMPCGGYVFVVSKQESDMYEKYLGAAPRQYRGFTASYVQTYHITDPNGYVSDTHLYNLRFDPGGSMRALVASVHNAWQDDDGVSECDPIEDLALHKDPGSNGRPYHDGGDGLPTRKYNADVFGMWGDVGASGGSKRHGNGAANDGDATGCEVGTEWECGPSGDNDEGNSHPYNPQEVDSGKPHSHSAALVDLWFYSDNPDPQNIPPTNPRYKIYDVYDVEPNTVPCYNNAGFHDHC